MIWIKLVILDISIYSICEIAICSLGTNADDNIAQQIEEAEAKSPEDLTEEDKMALLGRPKNGDIIRAQLRIKESKEFKVSST